MRMERVQTQCDAELLDCGVAATKPKLAPSAPMPCDDEVWVQLDRSREMGFALLDLTGKLGERVSCRCKNRWIVPIKFNRPPRESLGFTAFVGYIGGPIEDSSQD
ncbi:hypothetical protein [Bradyrhizobium neotropicale]|uniref:hypothetical protein n=1 Tax=Bradyrhizobium neotropicale TaxID=1497615 RepID=UPI000ACBA3A6